MGRHVTIDEVETSAIMVMTGVVDIQGTTAGVVRMCNKGEVRLMRLHHHLHRRRVHLPMQTTMVATTTATISVRTSVRVVQMKTDVAVDGTRAGRKTLGAVDVRMSAEMQAVEMAAEVA